MAVRGILKSFIDVIVPKFYYIEKLPVLTNTARRILVGAFCVSSQFAIFVTARVCVFRSEKTSVTLFVTLDAKIAAKTFLRFCKASRRFGKKHLIKTRLVILVKMVIMVVIIVILVNRVIVVIRVL
jgi:hypothetical protein